VKQELEKTIEQVLAPSTAFARWRDAGAFAAVVPTLSQVGDDTLRAVDAAPRPDLPGKPLRKTLRLAALFSAAGGKEAERALRNLRFSNQDIANVSALVDRWTRYAPRLTATLASGSLPDDAELRRLAAGVGRMRVAAFVRLAAACWCATGAVPSALTRRLHRRLLTIAFGEPIELADLALDGDDLRSAGIAAGPALGRVLHALLQRVIEDPSLNTRDALLAVARERERAPESA
jgi:tRNA nucleotidyltransferase (CCA-adding enzyme)